MELVDNPISIHELRKYTHLPSPTKGNGLNEDYIREILLQVTNLFGFFFNLLIFGNFIIKRY